MLATSPPIRYLEDTMSFVVDPIKKVLNSTAGRVVAGVATGGLSELGRVAARKAGDLGAPRIVQQGLGALVGSGTLGGVARHGVTSTNAAAGSMAAAANLAADTVNPNARKEAAAQAQAEAERQALGRRKDEEAQALADSSPYSVRKRAVAASQALGESGKRRSASAFLTS